MAIATTWQSSSVATGTTTAPMRAVQKDFDQLELVIGQLSLGKCSRCIIDYSHLALTFRLLLNTF